MLTQKQVFDYVYGLVTTPLNHGKAIEAVNLLYRTHSQAAPQIVFAASPNEATQMAKDAHTNKEKNIIGRGIYNKSFIAPSVYDFSSLTFPHFSVNFLPIFSSTDFLLSNRHRPEFTPSEFLLSGYLCDSYKSILERWLLAYKIHPTRAIPVDIATFDYFYKLAEDLYFFLPLYNICIISERPTKISFNSDYQIHCDNAPAIIYPNGDVIYAIDGVVMDRQTVEAPETLDGNTIMRIVNVERERITIQRYGWNNFLSDIKAEILDLNPPYEALLQGSGYTVLCTFDPSTGRFYALEVDPFSETCRQAQRYLLSPQLALEGLNINTKRLNSYPKLRT